MMELTVVRNRPRWRPRRLETEARDHPLRPTLSSMRTLVAHHDQSAPPAPDRSLSDADAAPLGPVPLTPFIGREREITSICEALRQESVRLLTLTGPGGVGKTRLALRVTEALAEDFPDGVWFVPLAAVRDPALVAETIGRVLGVRQASHRAPLDGIIAFLREKKSILLLDNFEQVLAAAPLLNELLRRCPHLTCVVTSRAILRVSGEHGFPISPLPLPPFAQSTTVTRAALSPAVQLFVSRARAARPTFAMTDANAAAIETICRRLDGLPLAIELAAARVHHFTPQELVARLTAGDTGAAFGVLAEGPRDAPARQQTLRYAIAWSYDLLAERERALFRRLAVFLGGFTLEAAEAVVDTAGGASIDVVDGITALLDQSLLHQEEGPDGTSRYEMLETIREFALEQLAQSGEEAAIQANHAAYFLTLAQHAAPQLSTEDQQLWLERLQGEHANLRAVLARAEQRQDVEQGLRMAAALWRFWLRRGFWEEGRGWLIRLLARCESVDDVDLATRAEALAGAGWLAHYQNDFRAAQVALEQSLACYRNLDRADGQVEVLHAQALVAQTLGENRRAVTLGEEALALARNSADPARIAQSLCCLSRAVRELGDYDRATALAEEALVVQREARNRGGTAIPLLVLGDLARDLGDTSAVRVRCEESLEIFRELGEPLGEGFSLHNLAVAAFGEGDLDLAQSLCEESLSIFRRLDVGNGIVEALASLGQILDAAGDPAAALAALNDALRLALRAGPRWAVAALLEGIARVAAGQREGQAAIELAAAAAALREEIAVPVRPNWHGGLERTLASSRSGLDEETIAAAWRRGQERSLAATMAAAAVVRIGSPVSLDLAEPAPAAGYPYGLSPRELDVLRLLVAGQTDREIADTLFISPRTASKHVGAILMKLDVASRSEAAVRAVRESLV